VQCFHQLYLSCFHDVYNFLLKLSGYQQSLAEELTQETFYHAFISFTRVLTDMRSWIPRFIPTNCGGYPSMID
jgi:RNA polymerase sigma-70 factor (ECF subfamily)